MEFLVLILVLMPFLGIFFNSMEEKNFRRGRLINCYNLDQPHKWAYNCNDRLECTACGMTAGEVELNEVD